MKINRRAQTYLSILTVAGFASARADDIPKRFNFDRYQGMTDRSPFAVATAVVAPASAPNFAKDLYVANAAKSPDGDMVTVASSSDKNFKEYLTTKETNEHGFAIANIEWSDKVGATKVTISKDNQFATLTFNQALLAQSAGPNSPNAPAPPPPQLPQPGPAMMPAQPNMPRPAPIPTLPNNNPRVRGVIPRNPETVTPPPRANQPDA